MDFLEPENAIDLICEVKKKKRQHDVLFNT
jgi:hypothetical protein